MITRFLPPSRLFKIIVALSVISTSTMDKALASTTSRDELALLGSCEREMLTIINKEFNKPAKAAIALGVGTVTGVSTFGIIKLSDSSVAGVTSSLEAYAHLAGAGGLGAAEGLGAGLIGSASGLIISVVATGVVIAAGVWVLEFNHHRNERDRANDVLQFFKDIKTNGMGPQIEIRTAALRDVLMKVSKIDGLKTWPRNIQSFNPQTYAENNIMDALFAVGSNIMASQTINCKRAAHVTELINRATAKYLIEKYNPGLTVELIESKWP
jgi:hypothetical protein